MRTVCKKEHVKDLPLWPVNDVHFRYTKSTGDTYINGYAVVKIFQRMGLHRHASELGARIADIVQKD